MIFFFKFYNPRVIKTPLHEYAHISLIALLTSSFRIVKRKIEYINLNALQFLFNIYKHLCDLNQICRNSSLILMKKRAPDWLNSSLWSSPHPPPSPPRNDSAIAAAVSPPAAAIPPEPPASSAYTHTTKGENKDPLSTHDGYNAIACCSDEENGGSSANSTASLPAPPANLDISRQTQILEEVLVLALYLFLFCLSLFFFLKWAHTDKIAQ